MALVTVQRSPSPSNTPESDVVESSSAELLDSPQGKSRSLSESYLTVKGAALILPQSECHRRITKGTHAGDMQNHLQAMFHLLRPQDTIKLAVKLESGNLEVNRYLTVVTCIGRQDTEECLLLGIDINERTTIGLVLPVWADTKIRLDGDGGFIIDIEEKCHIFKPVSVQAMWSALQSLYKVTDVAMKNYYYPGGLTHTWMCYYESRIKSDRASINEWHLMEDVTSHRSDSPIFYGESAVTDQEKLHCLIKNKLREIMLQVDLEEVTSKYLRLRVEEELGMSLKEYRSYIDNEMLIILGQMDSASEILDFLYLGSEWNASNLEELRQRGIGYILNVTREIDNFFPGMFEYMNIRLFDEKESDLLKYWEKTHRFISRARDRGSKCLVHCKMGISRSASTVIAFAMKEYSWSLKEALKFVKDKRGCVRPNPGFMAQLETYQGILDASNQRHNKLWKSMSDTDLNKDQEGGGMFGDENETPEYTLPLTPQPGRRRLLKRPKSWCSKQDGSTSFIVVTDTMDVDDNMGEDLITYHFDTAGYTDLHGIHEEEFDAMEECYPDIPSPMQVDPPVYADGEGVELIAYNKLLDRCYAKALLEAVTIATGGSSSSSSETSDMTAGFYNCLRLHDMVYSEQSGAIYQREADQQLSFVKLRPDGSWIKAVPPSPEPSVMFTITGIDGSVSNTDNNNARIQDDNDDDDELDEVITSHPVDWKDEIALSAGTVRKQTKHIEQRIKQVDRIRTESMSSMDSMDETCSDPGTMETVTADDSPQSTTSPKKQQNTTDSQQQQPQQRASSVIYETENIQLSPGLVKRTKDQIERRRVDEKAGVGRSSSMRENRVTAKVEIASRRMTTTERPSFDDQTDNFTLLPAAPTAAAAAADSDSTAAAQSSSITDDFVLDQRSSSDDDDSKSAPTSPVVSRRKKQKTSSARTDEEDSLMVYRIGDAEVVVHVGKVKRRTMDFEQLKHDTETMESDDASKQQSEESGEEFVGADAKLREIEAECPLMPGTVKLQKEVIENRMVGEGTSGLTSPVSPESVPSRGSIFSPGSPIESLLIPVDGEPVVTNTEQGGGSSPTTSSLLLVDELPNPGVVREKMEKIENKRQRVGDVSSNRMSKQTLQLICDVGESLQSIPKGEVGDDDELVRKGFVKLITKAIECTTPEDVQSPDVEPEEETIRRPNSLSINTVDSIERRAHSDSSVTTTPELLELPARPSSDGSGDHAKHCEKVAVKNLVGKFESQTACSDSAASATENMDTEYRKETCNSSAERSYSTPVSPMKTNELSSRKVRKLHGKTHPLERLNTEPQLKGPFYNTM
ncbi:uncharacterized protein LOC141898664 isoform X2 [Tubulanus polymorphus]|uniref:uncharacterized protein LOC141898664 isoform X2 n=1 Tax=Tubulanus polymorphus TaxID=672921 RepID=UPI003DA52B2D